MVAFDIANALVTIAAAVIAGIGWNTFGIWNTYKEKGIAGVDFAKVKVNLIIGTVVGIVGYGLSVLANAPITPIGDINTFIIAVTAFFPFIVAAERIFARKSDPVE